MTEPPTITVSADAQINVAPTHASIALGVETTDPVLATAHRENELRMTRVLAAAKAMGVDGAHLSTDHVGVELCYEWHDSHRKLVGYTARRSVMIIVHDLANFDAVLAAALDAGANFVHDVHFDTKELRAHRDKARALAMRAAHEKAVAMAGELGQKVGAPRTITEGGNGYGGYASYSWSARDSRHPMGAQNVMHLAAPGGEPSSEGATAPGRVAVRASVHVVFDLLVADPA